MLRDASVPAGRDTPHHANKEQRQQARANLPQRCACIRMPALCVHFRGACSSCGGCGGCPPGAWCTLPVWPCACRAELLACNAGSLVRSPGAAVGGVCVHPAVSESDLSSVGGTADPCLCNGCVLCVVCAVCGVRYVCACCACAVHVLCAGFLSVCHSKHSGRSSWEDGKSTAG